MKLPTIHSNGTSAKTLAENYQSAATKLAAALTALEGVELNGRDYYPQGDGAFSKASEEHLMRCKDLQALIDEMQEIADHCWSFVK
jgi:hypothetical protein